MLHFNTSTTAGALLVLSATAMLSQSARAATELSRDLPWQRDGKWANSESAVEASPQMQLEKAIRLEESGHLEPAANAFRLYQINFPLSPGSHIALARRARVLFLLKRYDQATLSLRLRHRLYPNALTNAHVAEIYVLLGKAYVSWAEWYDKNDEKGGRAEDRPPLSQARSMDRAAMVFSELVEVDPNGRLADEGVYSLGLLAMKRNQWEEAIARFEELLAEYKTSKFRPESEAQIGICLLRRHRSPRLSSEPRQKALDHFKRAEIEARGQRRKLNVDIKWAREQIDRVEAERTWMRARYYQKKGNYRAAGIYYNILINKYPASRYVVESKERLEKVDAISKRIRKIEEARRKAERPKRPAEPPAPLKPVSQAQEMEP